MATILKPHQPKEVQPLPSVDRPTIYQSKWPSTDDLDGGQPRTTQQPYWCIQAADEPCLCLSSGPGSQGKASFIPLFGG